ncbi:hypothetical protein VKT23_008672 [Stygiomarasmius scandens]|uniref:Uncharacterized protein n=1 Tax=Marasmiellus scandens TaxID=2682957 RepID=A0ABR1JH26_9AGAR
MANDYGEFDDGRENDDDLPTLVIPAANTSAVTLFQRLQEAQLQNQELRKRLANQRLLTSSLKADVETRGKPGRKRDAPIDSALQPYKDWLFIIGKRFTLMHEPWIEPNCFMRPLPPDSPDAYSLARFERDFKFYKDNQISELHDSLADPELIRLAIGLPALRTEFQKCMTAQRSNSTDRCRQNASHILRELSLPSTPMTTADAGRERAECQAISSLFRQSDNPTSIFAPIHFPGLLPDNDKLFLNEFQPRIIRACLFGASSIKTRPEDFKYSSRLLGMEWGVKSVNASVISWSAIMLRFLVSPDTVFGEKGDVSQVQYREHFYKYRKIILSNEIEGTSYAKTLYGFYNSRVFTFMPGYEEPDQVDAEDEVALMIQRLREVDLEDDTPSPPTAPFQQLPTTVSPDTASGSNSAELNIEASPIPPPRRRQTRTTPVEPAKSTRPKRARKGGK